MFVHCVYFWLKEGLEPKQVADFRRGVESLTKIASVRHAFAGEPASTDRPIIDRSYSYALVAVFEDKAGHDVYQEDPVHGEFRRNCSDFWRQVKIYDFVEG